MDVSTVGMLSTDQRWSTPYVPACGVEKPAWPVDFRPRKETSSLNTKYSLVYGLNPNTPGGNGLSIAADLPPPGG